MKTAAKLVAAAFVAFAGFFHIDHRIRTRVWARRERRMP